MARLGPAGLDGPFGLALDIGDGRRLLARDALATKPLFWTALGGPVRAAGEPGSLLAGTTPEADERAVLEWLLYRQVMAPATLFRSVRALEPGTAAIVGPDDRDVVATRFAFALDLLSAERYAELDRMAESALLDEVERTLLGCVERACRGHGEVGVLLSGGIDSAMVAAMARRFARVTGFTMGIDGAEALDETSRATAMAKRLDIPLVTARVSPRVYARLAPAATVQLGSPLFHVANVGLNVGFGELMAQAAGRGITRVLGGDSAGTALGVAPGRMTGLRWLVPVARWLDRLPGGARAAMLKLLLDREGPPVTVPELASSALAGLRSVDFGARARLDALAMAAAAFLRDPLERRVKATAVADLLNWLPRFCERDAMVGVAHGVDFGLPFHDAAMMRLGLNLPLRYLMRPRGWRARQSAEKWTLAQIAPRHLGDATFFHRGTVWSSPQRQFVEPLAGPLLTPDGYVAGLMHLDADGLRQEVAAARRDPSQLAKLVHLELWGRTCLRGEAPEALGERIAAAVDGR